VTDRLGSVRFVNSAGSIASSYYPYGEERVSTADSREKFATYFRDSGLGGQDYADQRYYNNLTGRFWSPDPGGISTANAKDPGSWNRYAYTQGDPVNFRDSRGLVIEAPDGGITFLISVTIGWYPYYSGPSAAGAEEDQVGGGGVRTASIIYTLALFSAFQALKDPDCSGIFNTSPVGTHYDPADVLAVMAFGGSTGTVPAGTYFGSIAFSSLPLDFAAVAKPDPSTSVLTGKSYPEQALSANIILQSSHLSDGYYGAQTPQNLAVTLIHELGHLYNEVAGMGGSKVVYDANPDGTPNAAAEAANVKTLEKCHPK